MNTVPSDNGEPSEPERERRSEVQRSLDELRGELSESLESFEGRILGISRQTPEWSVLDQKTVQDLFALPIDGSFEKARLGPRATAVAAAELESFIDKWLADTPSDESPDAEQLRAFSDDAHAFVETLEVIESTARQRTEHAHRRLDDWRDTSLAELNELRQSDIEEIENLIEEGDLESGHDARAERATIWEEQRERAAELTDFAAALHDLIEEGRDRTLGGIKRLAVLFDDTCDALERRHPELGDYRPIDQEAVSELDSSQSETVVAPTDILDDAVDASTSDTDSEEPADGSGEDHTTDTVADPGPPTRTDDPDDEKGSDTDHLVRADASSSSRPFLRTPPPESEHDPDIERNQDQSTSRNGVDDSHESLPRRHDSTFIDPATGRETTGADTGHGLGLESSSDLQDADADDDASPTSDISSSLQVQVEQTATQSDDPGEPARPSESGQFVRGEDAPPLESGDTESEPDRQSASDDQTDAPQSPKRQSKVQSPPIDSPVAARCARFRSEWREVPASALFAALAIPGALIAIICVMGLGYTAGLPVPNPLQAWPWLESASAVALLWLAAAPPFLGWRVKWNGWRCRPVQHLEMREDGRLRLDTDGLLIHGLTLSWSHLEEAMLRRFEMSSGDRGWMLTVSSDHTDDITVIAPADDAERWAESDAPLVAPPDDAWQTDPDTVHNLARYLAT